MLPSNRWPLLADQIAQVKEKVAAEKGWDAAQQKLIYSGSWHNISISYGPATFADNLDIGKILVDSHTVESYNIEEKGFIVCMVSKVCYEQGYLWHGAHNNLSQKQLQQHPRPPHHPHPLLRHQPQRRQLRPNPTQLRLLPQIRPQLHHPLEQAQLQQLVLLPPRLLAPRSTTHLLCWSANKAMKLSPRWKTWDSREQR
jgi:Ubiquitin family